MKYDDLEKTMELFEINEEVPTPIENIEMEGASKNNVTDEFTLGLRDKEVEEIKEKNNNNKKKKKSLKERWQLLSKKNKIIIIIGIIAAIIVIIGLILFFVLKSDNNPKNKPNKDDTPAVVLEKDNYIYRDGKLSLLNLQEQEVGVYECQNKNETLCYVASFSEEDNFDTLKQIYEDDTLVERASNIFNDKYVFIYDSEASSGGNIILYNIETKETEGEYKLVKGFKDSNYVILKDKNNKYGAIEINDSGITEKIKFTYEYLGIETKDSKIVAKTNNKYFILNRDGKVESKGVSSSIKSYNDKYIVVDNNGYFIYDYESKLVFDDAYDFIGLDEEYMSLVKENKLYIKDYNKQSYNEEDLELGNDNYVVTNVYSKNKKLKETKMAYKIEQTDDKLEVTYFNKNNKEKTAVLSINEGKLSGKYSYINYFNGTFYFYKDETKSELIGKYSCSNKNIINKDTTSFSNCYIASDTFYSKNDAEIDNSGNVGWIPIINERYVFMTDALDVNNPTIILYDLTDNKIKGKYSSVDSGSYTKKDDASLKETTSMYIMAENKNKKYGVIKIENEAKSAIAFNYASIEKVNESFLVKESNGTYSLLNKDGSALTDKYAYKIMDYSHDYLSVLDNNKYYLYDFEGNKKDYESYLYISLKDDYYVIVNEDQKLDLRKYDDSFFSLSNPIDIESNDIKNAFEVTKDKNGYTIKLKDTGATIKADLNGNIGI